MGGLVTIQSNFPSTAEKPSPQTTSKLSRPFSFKLRSASAAARSLTSVSTKRTSAHFFASTPPSAPQPQPRSSTRPDSGGSASSSTRVPASSPSRENTPASVMKSIDTPSTRTLRRRSSCAEAGAAV